jgi:hypothetical protein
MRRVFILHYHIIFRGDVMLNQKAFGLAGGVLWGGAIGVLTIISLLTGYATPLFSLISSVYLGFSVSVQGIFIGVIYGFIDAFVGCYIFAWLYNKFAKK